MTTTLSRWVQAGDGPQGDAYIGDMVHPIRLKRFQDYLYLSQQCEWLKQVYYERGQRSVLQVAQNYVDNGLKPV